MGLAAAKDKRRLGHDPNNTRWSRNSDSFGQKILRAQGWQPGQYLGAKDAPHAEWHTEANSAHIRVVLKDDTLGLGARRNNGDECTGLDAFQHLLGRLNGKSDETLETERKAREDLKLSLYVERKLGTIRFVKGGWLVGDQVKDTPDDEAPISPEPATISAPAVEASEPAAEKSKKRKAGPDSDGEDGKARKREKKSKKRKAKSEAEVDSNAAEDKRDKRKSKKRKADSEGPNEQAAAPGGSKRSTDAEKAIGDSAEGTAASVSKIGECLDKADPPSESTQSREKKRGKKDKKDNKDRKNREEKRGKAKASLDSGMETMDNRPNEKERRRHSVVDPSTSTPAESGTSTPGGSGYSTPVPTGSSRYLARSRFIAQKKLAFTDSAALNQIFMIKS